MNASDNLIPNESIVFESKKHWFAPARDSLPGIGLLILALLVGWISPDSDGGLFGAIGNLLGLIQLGLVIVGIVAIAYAILTWRTASFAVTTLRVLRYEGLIQRRTSETLLTAVSDVKLNVGILGRQLGYGDLVIMTMSGDAGADRFATITQPTEFRNALMVQKLADQQADRAGNQPALAPAAPAPAAPAAPAPAPAAPAPAPAAPSATAAETADAIKRLADLRDQGLLTPEEFEAKKSEILARM